MSIRSEYREQLEAYFSGEMQGADRILFEGRVESDPILKEEFDAQNEIIEGLKAHRKMELKARLNNISVEPTLIGALLQSSAFKPMLYAVTGVAVSVGSYNYFNTAPEKELFVLDGLESKNLYHAESVVSSHKAIDLNYRYQHIEPVRTPVVENIKEETVVEKTTTVKEIKFEVPQIGDQIQDEEYNTNRMIAFEGAEKIDEVPSVSKIDKVSIQTINSRRYDFHYRMEENRLYLYGKFDQSPYEIIEINSPGTKELFFYYDGGYYRLNKSASAITKLKQIQNEDLVDQLSGIKEANKL